MDFVGPKRKLKKKKKLKGKNKLLSQYYKISTEKQITYEIIDVLKTILTRLHPEKPLM